jgi:hypothetical protein
MLRQTAIWILIISCLGWTSPAQAAPALHGGLNRDGQPQVAIGGRSVLYNWDGQPQGPGLPSAQAGSSASELRRELDAVISRLGLSEADTQRIFITPDNGQLEQDRLLAVTTTEHGVFQSTIYDFDDYTVLAELNLDSVFASLYGGMSGDPAKREFNIGSVARNSRGDLILMMFFSAGGTLATEFGSWDGENWAPIFLPESYAPHNTLRDFSAKADPWKLDRIHTGPNNEILLCAGDKTVSFYGRDMATGGFILLDSYNAGEVAGHGRLASERFWQTAISIALIFLCSIALLVILLQQLRRVRLSRDRA